MKQLSLIILITICFFSCKKKSDADLALENNKIDISIERFDRFFAKTNLQELPKLKKAYPFMFPKAIRDSVWIDKVNDTLQQELSAEVDKVFADYSNTEDEIESLLSYIQYYFPTFKTPRVITTTSNVDYRNRVIVTDTIVLVALDSYLGEDHYFYQGIPKYISEHLNKEQIVVDLAEEYAEKYIFQPERKTLLDEMIYFGKALYFKDKVIPFKLENERISYSQEQLNWVQQNESSVWQYFVERELLFSTNSKLPNRFINPAPFSKFYLEGIDGESPGKIGQYIGWQIVKAYMEHNDTSLNDMLIMNAEDIFNKSKFKPRKNNG
ncbi:MULTISPECIES: gliding motility lipoprotein GldB [unclassified Algibacter]|uniref:gliding motility lipoprotein GldB n=1 Tax=unclassified Algibacter TaxID=2615009 RepID=UPI00131DE28F|nr:MULTISPECIES: gliding motility lipoprotein GldB [unclassified Algibacter]MCL5130097.1 gliding motility lipoprotein GldB [Algibacter sp. L4_22]